MYCVIFFFWISDPHSQKAGLNQGVKARSPKKQDGKIFHLPHSREDSVLSTKVLLQPHYQHGLTSRTIGPGSVVPKGDCTPSAIKPWHSQSTRLLAKRAAKQSFEESTGKPQRSKVDGKVSLISSQQGIRSYNQATRRSGLPRATENIKLPPIGNIF